MIHNLHSIACSFQHEAAGKAGDISIVLEAVRTCTLRLSGKNILCAHLDSVFGLGNSTIHFDLEKRIQKLGDKDLSDMSYSLNSLKHVIDDFMRISFTKGSWYTPSSVPKIFIGDDVIVSCYNEMKNILIRCHIIGNEQESQRILNQGERTRFNFLAAQIQQRVYTYYQDLVKTLEKREGILL